MASPPVRGGRCGAKTCPPAPQCCFSGFYPGPRFLPAFPSLVCCAASCYGFLYPTCSFVPSPLACPVASLTAGPEERMPH